LIKCETQNTNSNSKIELANSLDEIEEIKNDNEILITNSETDKNSNVNEFISPPYN